MNEYKMRREIRRDYHKDLESSEWFRFSCEFIKAHGNECFNCGSEERLEVHHLTYRNIKPWEYSSEELRVLCRECHRAIHIVADDIWVELLKYDPHELELILKRLRRGQPNEDWMTRGLCKNIKTNDTIDERIARNQATP